MAVLRISTPPVLWGEQMHIALRRESLVLCLGDILFLFTALWLTLFVRYATPPSVDFFYAHLVPFSALFGLSIVVFFIAGLYEKHTLLFKSTLPQTVFYTQLTNILVAALIFFLIPYFGIQPKTNLVIYLVLSTALVTIWRLYLFPALRIGRVQKALLIGSGAEVDEVLHEINGNNRYAIRFTKAVPVPSSESQIIDVGRQALSDGVSVIVLPFSLVGFPLTMPEWRKGVDNKAKFIDTSLLYEDLFDRVPLAVVTERWLPAGFLRTNSTLYSFFKRLMDISISLALLIVLSPIIIVVTLVSQRGGGAFIFQKRIGQHGKEIRIIKFRTMLFDDAGDPEKQKLNRVTRIGRFLRKTQIDEIPQFINVLRGDLSLIGPRPEIPVLVDEYEKAIPFYGMRHMIPPGISGWAQIKHASPPKFRLDIERTREKLSYDLYYVKHRSFMTDLSVALQTIKILLSRTGS